MQHLGDAAAGGLAIEPTMEYGQAVVRVTGELDLATVGILEQTVQDLLASGCPGVVLDLRELAFIDSTGLRMLLRLDDLASDCGRRFGIVEGTGPVRRLLRLTGLDARFAADARTSVGASPQR
ncbi:STAS domain-containing protein [Conexibacter arvalis]|uniref:Anti-sigma factor antagonist n=1 Tax=Conexibacter arvalis TaxID=912552 RepID=A0A840IC39_9ACTN|nr:STAS domain-containing protein [Conexibacter arvalis]MBB4662282.1 anti-anti-sigma factor [Conexibacter arvalis]